MTGHEKGDCLIENHYKIKVMISLVADCFKKKITEKGD
jgi:hypothetical protein